MQQGNPEVVRGEGAGEGAGPGQGAGEDKVTAQHSTAQPSIAYDKALQAPTAIEECSKEAGTAMQM